MKHLKQLTTRNVAFIAIFSALYYVLSFLPGIKIAAGAANVSIQIEAFMASIFGLILGPYLGALTAFTGALVAWILPPGLPTPSSAVFLLSPVINALVVGFIYTRRWKIAFLVLALTVSAFWFLPAAQPWDQYSYIGFYAMWDKIIALALIIPSAILMNKVAKGPRSEPENVQQASWRKKIDIALLLSLVAALLILANAWMIGSGENVKFQFAVLGTTFSSRLVSKELFLLVSPYGYAWLVLGAGVLICSSLLYMEPKRRNVWSALIFLFSCLSVLIGGGFFAGVFLGVLGAIFGVLKGRFTFPRVTLFGDMSLFFLLAFIGNEADNALGNDLFAIPLVYKGIFQIPLDVLRWMFTVGPFFYFAVRLLQAVITSLIATPLMRNLKASGLSKGQPTEAEEEIA